MTEQKVSPRQFDVLQRAMLELELQGHGPEACVIGACKRAGITPPRPFEPMTITVDPMGEPMTESPLRDLARKLRQTAREHIAYSQVADLMNHVDEHLNALAFCEETNRASAGEPRHDR
jgi:hypothetical protein